MKGGVATREQITKMVHAADKHRCVKSAKWDSCALRCPKCKSILAIRYQVDKDVRIYCYAEYSRWKKEILANKAAYQIAGFGDLLGTVTFTEWDNLLSDIKSAENAVFPVQTDARLEIAEDCKRQDANGVCIHAEVEEEMG